MIFLILMTLIKTSINMRRREYNFEIGKETQFKTI